MASPFKYDTESGWNTCLPPPRRHAGEQRLLVRRSTSLNFDPEAVSNQAIAYSVKTLARSNLYGWSLLEPVEEEDKTKSDVVEIVQPKKASYKRSCRFTSSGIEEIGLKVGDVVGFKENRDYRIKIDGKEYYRTRIEDLLYVENNE